MEAHTGTISIRRGKALKPRRRRLAEIVVAIRKRRLQRAERVHSIRVNGARVDSVPGSEHAHLMRRPRGF